MSVNITREVWPRYSGDPTRKLVLLCLADHAHEDGAGSTPSMQTIARECCISESQARRHVHALIESEHLVEYVRNREGGNAAPEYRVRTDHLPPRIGATPGTDATPCTDATPSAHACHPSHGCKGRGSTHDTRTINEPPITKKPAPYGAGRVVWDEGLRMLQAQGLEEKQARTFLGMLVGKYRDGAVASVIERAAAMSPMPVDLRRWMQAQFKGSKPNEAHDVGLREKDYARGIPK